MGKFILKKTLKGNFIFNLIAKNGETIGTSEVYTTKDSCKKGIASVAANAIEEKVVDLTVNEPIELTNPKFEIYKDKAEEFRFRLRAKNGQNILASEGYSTKANCKKGILSVCTNADDPEIIEIED